MKKLLALALCLTMVLGCMSGLSLVAFAADLDGAGTLESPYIIDSADKFKAVFGNGTTADLTAVYLLTGFDQTAMELTGYTAERTKVFTGKLLGGNFVDGAIVPVKQKINLTVTITKEDKNGQYTGGIFHQVKNAEISDLALYGTMDVPSINWNQYIGALAGVAGGTAGTPATYCYITRVDNHIDITSASKQNYGFGGIAGKAQTNVRISACNNYGDIYALGGDTRALYTGGIAGEIYLATKISESANYGKIQGCKYVGGIAGFTNYNSNQIVNCVNFGDVSSTNATIDTFVGSMAGSISVVGKDYTATIKDCYNLGVLSSAKNIGLVAGLNAGKLTVSNFYDVVNPDVKSVIGSDVNTSTVTNAYGYSETPSATENDVTKVSYEELAALTETVEAFMNTAVWEKQDGYAFPALKNNIIAFGTGEIPYLVYTIADLKNVSNAPAANYKLMANIGVMDEMLCKDVAFSGVFDGNGKSIELALDESGYKGSADNRKYVGLFSQVTGTIKNLTTKGTVNVGYVDYQEGAGAIVGMGSGSFNMDNCKNYANVTSQVGHQTAGLAGRVTAGTISNCYNYGDVKGYRTSGIVGLMSSRSSKITNCGNYGDITADYMASGICSWIYVWNWIDSCFNVGTITALNPDGTACGLFGNMTNGSGHGHNIQRTFNAGSLIADTTYGIVMFNPNNTKNTALRTSYNVVAADYPIANNVALANVDAKYTSYYVDPNGKDDEIAFTTAIDLETLKTTLPDTNFIVAGSAYKYPQLKNAPLDEEYADIDFSLVTIDNQVANGTEVKVKASDDASFYLQNGTELKLDVKVADKDFYVAYVNGDILDGNEAAVTVNGNTVVTITDEKAAVEVPEEVVIDTYTFDANEALTLGEEVYENYALVASRAGKFAGLKLTGFGLYLSDKEDITKDNYMYDVAADSNKISAEGAYGILLYNAENGVGGMKAGTTYYALPYAAYVDVEGNTYVLTGTVGNFTYAE